MQQEVVSALLHSLSSCLHLKVSLKTSRGGRGYQHPASKERKSDFIRCYCHAECVQPQNNFSHSMRLTKHTPFSMF